MRSKPLITCLTICAIALLAGMQSEVLLAQSAPPVTIEPPGPGKRVRVTNPEYAGSDVYHALYLPTDWQPGVKYPVIIEYAGNPWSPDGSDGSPDETQLGYYQSAGQGFIWASMPMIDTLADPDKNALTWWGNHPAGVIGEDVAADYTKVGLIDILENYGGDPASVFVTGFSRGAIAAGQVGLRDQLADAWLGFLPHSHHFQLSSLNAPQRYPLLDSIAGRASFITSGENGLDGGYGSSIVGRDSLTSLGFPNEFREMPGEPHTVQWIEDTASATSLAVRAEMRTWLADTIANRPGTSSVSGNVTDSLGAPISDVRIQSGDTHWTFTDANGDYQLPSLIDSSRILTATHPFMQFTNPSVPITISGTDLMNFDFAATTPIGPLPGDLNGDDYVGSDDMDIVKSFWGQSVTPGDLLSGDPSGDGFVGGDDFDLLREFWGLGTPPPAASSSLVVPEPGALAMLTMSGLALVVLPRRHRDR
ncbi:hypothetical protein OAS39_05505 [Pirellulales bacterium]|nr:hypothetical protein [Pirellulales bacterium]